MSYKILAINPGSTSTKIGVYEGQKQLFESTLRHSTEELLAFSNIIEQKDFRRKIILEVLNEHHFEPSSLSAVVGRGGLLKPIPGGTYAITDDMLKDLSLGVQGSHASNLGGILAKEIAEPFGIPSFIVDPVVVDEMDDIARLSGMPELPRISIFHALNQKAVAKRYAREKGVPYDSLRLIVAHMGGGVSVGAHAQGKVVDVNNTLDGDGPFSPERSGGVPAGALVKLCFSGQFSEQEIYKKIVGKGGFSAYLGSNNMKAAEDAAFKDGNQKAMAIIDSFIYQVSKEIGALAAALSGKVDQIILTGGIAYGAVITDAIRDRVSFISDVTVYPGEDELQALAEGTLRVLTGEEEVKQY